jgi:antitoxin component YwqK of YwqJK toxin-antitoxin module
MEMDSMAPQVLSRNSIYILLICLFFFQCEKKKSECKVLNMDSVSVTTQGGITYVNTKKYSGLLYRLYPNSTDTIELRNYKEGREHGYWKQFYTGKILKELRFFDDGRKEGPYEGWWENGNRKFDYVFRNDEYEGTCREWSADKRLTREMNYHLGHEEGSQKVWYDNGKIRSNYIITDGRRYGLLGTKNCSNVSDSIF